MNSLKYIRVNCIISGHIIGSVMGEKMRDCDAMTYGGSGCIAPRILRNILDYKGIIYGYIIGTMMDEYLTECDAMKTYWGSGCTAPRILRNMLDP
jgi:hypothetical protein